MDPAAPQPEQFQAEVVELRRRLAESELALKGQHDARLAYWEYDVISDQFILNDSFYQLHGLTAAEAGGYQMGATDFVRRFVHPAWTHPVSEAIRQAAISLAPQFEHQIEGQLLTAQQEAFWAAIWFRTEKDSTGHTVKVHGLTQDITARKQAEDARQQSEARYRRITATLTDYIYTVRVVDDQPVETRHGPGCVAITGYTPEEFEADPYLWFRMVTPEDQPRVQAQAQQVLKNHDAPPLEHRLVRKDGTERWVRNTPVPHYDQQGRLTSYDGLIQDITDRRRAEVALAVSEARYRSLIETQTEIIARSDLAGHLTFVNEAYCQMFGKSQAELIGSSFIFTVWPEDVPISLSTLDALRQPPHRTSTETRHITPRGLRWISWENTAILDENHQLLELQGAGRDITDRKQGEEALRESETRFRETLEYLPVAIGLSNGAGENIFFNQAFTRLFGYTREELPTINDWWQRAYPDPEYRSEVQAAWADSMAQAIRAGTATEVQEARVTCKDGTVREVALRTRLLGDLYIVSSIDITERKEMEAALRQERARLAQRVEARTEELSARTAELQQANAELVRASRLKDEFLANMSHELRTPLTAILGLAEALQMGTYGPVPDKQSAMLQVIRQSGQHLLALISDILDLSKIEAGKGDLQLAPVAVSEVCQSSLHFINQPAQKKNIHVTFAPDPLVRLILTDARRLKQMIVTLLGNAIKFTPEGGEVGLEVVGDPARRVVRFTVWDNGIGIPTEKQELLFQPFVQVDGGLNRQYEGVGLGLALTRRLAEMQGGSITAESSGTGQGSRFSITLPWLPAETSSQLLPRTETAARLVMPSGRPAVILLADDNEAILTTIGDFLQSLSAKVVGAANGAAVLARARTVRPDLIVIDIQMPGLDGLETIQQLRAMPETAHTPIIVLTALALGGDRERWLSAGASDYLSKPVKLKDLIDAAVRLIAQANTA
jgi:PAS domain S-box-containing protein